MSTTFSPASSSLGMGSAAERGVYRVRHRFDGARGLAAMLLAAAVSALVVVADQMISTWADGHLFLGWVILWVVVFAGSALLAGSARRLARATLEALDGWSRSLAEARAEARLWDLARTDPRLKAELLQARAREADLDETLETAAHGKDYSDALAPLGLDAGMASPIRRWAQVEVRRQMGYLPYL